MKYLSDPDAIYRQSFATIRAEADLSGIAPAVRDLAIRMIHACGMADIARDIRIDPQLPAAVERALDTGKPVFADCEMVRSAITTRQLPPSSAVVCTLNDHQARRGGLERKITRSAAAVGLWQPRLEGAVVVIGNAPTALFALLEMIDAGNPSPAAIIATPVGFVGATEAKSELAGNSRGIPFITLLGRRGGSAIAAAAFNAVIAGRDR